MYEWLLSAIMNSFLLLVFLVFIIAIGTVIVWAISLVVRVIYTLIEEYHERNRS